MSTSSNPANHPEHTPDPTPEPQAGDITAENAAAILAADDADAADSPNASRLT
ncbi:hypothetical protein GZ997_05170, partial [Actinomyces sp. 565]|nr:hypothetical protein [Actinomyces sp. 565]